MGWATVGRTHLLTGSSWRHLPFITDCGWSCYHIAFSAAEDGEDTFHYCLLKMFLSRDKWHSHWARLFFSLKFLCFHEAFCSPQSGIEETGYYWDASPVEWGVEPKSARDASAGCLRINPHPFLPGTPANLFPFLCHGSQEHSWQYCSTCVSTDFIRAPWKYLISVCFINTITTHSPLRTSSPDGMFYSYEKSQQSCLNVANPACHWAAIWLWVP